MAKKRSTSKRKNKSGQSWLSPTYGYDVAYSDHAVRLKLFHEHKTDEEVEIIKTILHGVRALYGEHVVGGLASYRRGKPLEIGIWKERQHAYHVRAPISTVCDSSDWRALLDVEAEPHLLLSAERGTRDKRHYVWSLSRNGYTHTERRSIITLFLSLRHVRYETFPDLEGFIDDLLQRSVATRCCRSAFAEPCLARHFEAWGLNHAPIHRPGAEWMDMLWERLDESKHGYVRDVCWKMVLSPLALGAFGGVRGFQDRYREVSSRVFFDRPWSPPQPRAIDGHALHTLVTLSDVFEEFPWGSVQPHLLHETAMSTAMVLSEGQRMLVQSPALLDRYLERERQADRLREGLFQSMTADRDTADFDQIAAHVRTHPPSCIAGRGVLIEGDDKSVPSMPTGHHADNYMNFRVGLDAKQAFTVYGRMSRENDCLWGLVLVGSLKRDRAAFVFDGDMHGWDGYNPDRPPEDAYSSRRPTARLSQFVCPQCDGRHFRLFAEFEFSDETPQPFQEHFTWFTLVGECSGCNWAGTVADHECA